MPDSILQADPTLAPKRKATSRFMLSHPAHMLALGFGSGLSPIAPGTAGTLWAWLSFLLMENWLSDLQTGVLIAVSIVAGWWAGTVTARNMQVADPGSIVWDEIAAFWLILWLVMPAGFEAQLSAFLLFRFFDAVKPGPVGWADQSFKGQRADGTIDWVRSGFGIMIDDLLAAFCTLLVIAAWRFW